MEEKKSLGGKLKSLFGSLKFWIATLTMATMVLELFASGQASIGGVWNIMQTWLVAVFGVGVVDGVAERIGGSKLLAVIASLQKQLDEVKKKPE